MTTPFPQIDKKGEQPAMLLEYSPNQQVKIKRKLSTIVETTTENLQTVKNELKLTKQKLQTMENKNTELMSQVFDLRRLIKRIAYEEDLNIITMEKQLKEKNAKIKNLKQNLRLLEKNSKWLDDIACYWNEVVEKDMTLDSDEELKSYLKLKYGKDSNVNSSGNNLLSKP